MVRQRKAFTMLELLVVIGIIIVLMGLGVAAYTHLMNASAAKSTTTTLHLCQSLLAEYDQSSTIGALGGPPVQKIPLDPYLKQDANFPYPCGYLVDNSPTAAGASILVRGAAPIGLGPPDNKVTPVSTGKVAYSLNTTTNHYPMNVSPSSYDGFPYELQAAASNATFNTACVMMYLTRNAQVRQMISSVPSRSILQFSGKPITILVGNERADAPILLDGWGNPIIFVPAGGLVVNVTQGGTVATVLVRSSVTVPYVPGVNPPLSPTDRPFWASAGADANFDTGDDNVYSFQQ